MINIVWGSTDKPVSSRRLAELLNARTDLDGTLYLGYPIIGTPEGSFPIDALFVSPTKGLILFEIVEGRILSDYAEAQDENFNKMQAKLLQHQSLINKRKLLLEINTFTFAPAVANLSAHSDGEHVLCNADTLNEAINELEDIDPMVYPDARVCHSGSLYSSSWSKEASSYKRRLERL